MVEAVLVGAVLVQRRFDLNHFEISYQFQVSPRDSSIGSHGYLRVLE